MKEKLTSKSWGKLVLGRANYGEKSKSRKSKGAWSEVMFDPSLLKMDRDLFFTYPKKKTKEEEK